MRPHENLEHFCGTARHGVVAVVMDKPPMMQGVLHIPDEVQNHYFSHSGVIVASGESGYNIGDRALVAPAAGMRFGVFTSGEYDFEDVRFYGRATDSPMASVIESIEEIIPGVMRGDRVEDVQAMGLWVLVKRDDTVQSEGGIFLTDHNAYGTCKCTAISAGSRALDEGVRVGARYLLHPRGEILAEYFLDTLDPDRRRDTYSFIRATDLLMEL